MKLRCRKVFRITIFKLAGSLNSPQSGSFAQFFFRLEKFTNVVCLKSWKIASKLDTRSHLLSNRFELKGEVWWNSDLGVFHNNVQLKTIKAASLVPWNTAAIGYHAQWKSIICNIISNQCATLKLLAHKTKFQNSKINHRASIHLEW